LEITSIIELRNALKGKEPFISVVAGKLADKILRFKNIQGLCSQDIVFAMIGIGEHVDVITPLLGIDRVQLSYLHTDYCFDLNENSSEAKESTNSIILKLKKRRSI
jgi:hypothetical protein